MRNQLPSSVHGNSYAKARRSNPLAAPVIEEIRNQTAAVIARRANSCDTLMREEVVHLGFDSWCSQRLSSASGEQILHAGVEKGDQR
jgi:hypothetical protein